jgi:hypothetical protein
VPASGSSERNADSVTDVSPRAGHEKAYRLVNASYMLLPPVYIGSRTRNPEGRVS